MKFTCNIHKDMKFQEVNTLFIDYLYGLNQAPLLWFQKINKFSNENGLQESSSDGNMYYKNHSKKVVLLILYIDDSFLTRDNIERVSWLKKELITKFDMTSLGLCSKYLII
jgi:hypothetical protein